MDKVRYTVIQLLQKILDQKISFDEAFDQSVTSLSLLTDQQRHSIYYHTTVILRYLGVIDDTLQRCSKYPLDRLDSKVRAVLRLAVAELFFMGNPSYAVVDSAVTLVKVKHLKGFVNAVLRHILKNQDSIRGDQDAEKLALPQWLWQRWYRYYGEDMTRQIVRAQNQEPFWDVTVKQDPDYWAKRLDAQLLPNGTLRKQHLWPLKDQSGFKEGEWWIQGAESSMPVRFFPNLKGRKAIDLCAAPGGKTAQLIAHGAQVTAVDQSAKRLERLKTNLKRLHMMADIIQADSREWTPAHFVDAILFDAPCSATGTIRKNPDLPWLRTEADIKNNIEHQRQILIKALTYLKPGGVLIYAVCSLEPEEGPEQINWLLNQDKTIERWPLTDQDCFDDPQLVTSEGDLRTLPCYWTEWGGIQGFYTARLRKKGL